MACDWIAIPWDSKTTQSVLRHLRPRHPCRRRQSLESLVVYGFNLLLLLLLLFVLSFIVSLSCLLADVCYACCWLVRDSIDLINSGRCGWSYYCLCTADYSTATSLLHRHTHARTLSHRVLWLPLRLLTLIFFYFSTRSIYFSRLATSCLAEHCLQSRARSPTRLIETDYMWARSSVPCPPSSSPH